LYAGRGQDLSPWMADAEINTDRNLKLQFIAGLALNLYDQDAIYRAMLAYRKFPEDFFTGAVELREAVRRKMGL
jgi:spermidine synthase